MRAIDGDALLKDAFENDKEYFDQFVLTGLMPLARGAIKRLIDKQPTIESLRPDWTPCAEGLPKPRHKGQQRQAYLVSLETGCVSMMFYEFNPNGYLGEGWTDKIIGVIAWRELPEPYNTDRKEDAKSGDVSQWPDWKKRAALSNYEFGKED